MDRLERLGPTWQLTQPNSFSLGNIEPYGNVTLIIITARRGNDMVRHRMYQLESTVQARHFGENVWRRYTAGYQRNYSVDPPFNGRALWLKSKQFGGRSVGALWIDREICHFITSHCESKHEAQLIAQQVAGVLLPAQ
jgi:hypothetical protein